MQVGAFVEEPGQTGLAHFLEHMAFKGSSVIGTSDEAAESRVRDAQDEVFAEISILREDAEGGSLSADRAAKLSALEAKLAALMLQGAPSIHAGVFNLQPLLHCMGGCWHDGQAAL